MRRFLVLLVAAACSVEAPPAPATDTGSDLVDIGTLPTRWTLEPGWTVASVSYVGDVTGDGRPDVAIVAAEDGAPTAELLVVAGPLRRELTLPAGAIARVPGGLFEGAGDATGDGISDLDVRVSWDAERLTLVPGPLAGVVDPGATGIEHDGTLVDLDADGILDETTSGVPAAERIEITWGPVERWTGPPDVTVTVTCSSWHRLHWYAEPPHTTEDLDGDGVRELYVAGYDAPGCSGFVLPLPEAGHVDPVAAGAPSGLWIGNVVPDQTGDGLPDLLRDGELLAAPVTFVDGDVLGAATLPLSPGLKYASLQEQPFDLDGDGVADFLVDDGWTTLYTVRGGDALATGSLVAGWDVQGGRVVGGRGFLEDGIASALVLWTGGITVVDLGPADASP